jgi:hypothetical protein
MKKFEQFVSEKLLIEAKKEPVKKQAPKKKETKKDDDSNKIHAVMDLAEKIQSVFKKYTLNTRRKAWRNINSKQAQDLFEKLLINPSRSLSPFKSIATGKD